MEKTTKIGIATGIASSLLVMYLIDPILRVFGDFIQIVFSGMYAGFWDSLYLKAALGTPRDPALTIFSMATGVITGISAGALSVFIRRPKDKDTQANKENKPSQKSKRNGIIGLVVSSIFMAFFSLYQTWTLLLQYQVTTSFDQHIRIITPYITAKEKDLLLSQFSLMSSESDYLKLYEKLNNIAHNNNLRLPQNPSYSFWAL